MGRKKDREESSFQRLLKKLTPSSLRRYKKKRTVKKRLQTKKMKDRCNSRSHPLNPLSRCRTLSFSDSDFFSAEEEESDCDHEISVATASYTSHDIQSLSVKELAAVKSLLAAAYSANLDVRRCAAASAESEYHMAKRFLVARKWLHDPAFELLKKDIEWRESEGIYNILDNSTEDLLGISDSELRKYLPTWMQGFDKAGRPVMYKRFGRVEVEAICKAGGSVEGLSRWHCAENERMIEKLKFQTKEKGYPVQSFTFVIDAGGFSIRAWTRKAIRFVRSMAEIDSLHYPERLGEVFVVNCPRLLSIVWSAIRKMLDERQRSKIHMYSSPSVWVPILREKISKEQLSEVFGGDAEIPNLNCLTKKEIEMKKKGLQLITIESESLKDAGNIETKGDA
tara:strand:- start:346 stop:1530 length:1185 start_codon:yes stop_codon:yes gene_type:complete